MAASYLQSILASASTVDCLSNTRLAICETLRRLVRPDEEVCVDAAATGRNRGGPSVEFTESDGGLAVTLTSASRGFAFARFRVAVTTPLPATSRAALAQELELYAAVSGLVLRAMQLEADVSSAKASGEALVDASRLARIAPGLSVDELLTRMAAIVHRCISTEYVSIYLVNEASRSLFCMFSDTKTFAEYRSKKQFLQLQFGQGLPGAVAKAGAPLRVAHSATCADPGIDVIAGVVTRSALGVPISSYCAPVAAGVRPHLIGVIIARNKACGALAFDAQDEATLAALASEFAAVLDTCKHDLQFEAMLFAVPPESPSATLSSASASLLRHFWYGGKSLDGRSHGGMSTQRTPLVLAETASSLIAVSTPLHGSPTGSGSLPATWGRRRSVTATCAPTALLTISEPVAATMQLPFSAASPAAGPKAFSALHLERGDGPGTFAALAGRLGLCNTAESPLHLSTDSSIAAALTGAAAAILRGYRSLPYHNWRHALDTAHFLCRAIERTSEAGTAARLSPIDRLAALVAALGHDVDHRGHTNSFEASSLSELALTYNSDSVLEHHHAAVLFRTLHSKQHPALAQRMAAAASPPSSTAASAVGGAGSHSLIPHVPAHSNILGLDLADFKRLRQVAVDAILGTDMARHAELVDATRTRGATLAPNELITVLLHAADISAPLHPDFSVAYEWSERCNAEFAAQAAAEAAMGLPSAPFMHALGTRRSRASQQLVFLDFVVTPFWRTLSDAFPEIADFAAALPSHRGKYEDIAGGDAAAAVDSSWDDVGPPTFAT